MKTEVMLPDTRKESLSSNFRGSRPQQHLDLGFFNLRTVEQYISAIYMTQFGALCYSNPTKLICPLSSISCILASPLTMSMKCFPPSNHLYSGHSALLLVASDLLITPLWTSLYHYYYFFFLLSFLNISSQVILQESLTVFYMSCQKICSVYQKKSLCIKEHKARCVREINHCV